MLALVAPLCGAAFLPPPRGMFNRAAAAVIPSSAPVSRRGLSALLSMRAGAGSPTACEVVTLPTKPFEGMKPGTSGLRKKVKVVREGLYLHNFVQVSGSKRPCASDGDNTASHL